MRARRVRVISTVLGVIAVLGISAAVLGIVTRRPAAAVGEQRYSALLLHESQVFDQDWELVNGTAPLASLVKLRTHSWLFTEVVIQNPHSIPVAFCWRVTQPALIGTQDCTGTIPASGVVVFDSYQLEAAGKLVGPQGILEIETASGAPELVVWQHHNKHSTAQGAHALAAYQSRELQGRIISGNPGTIVAPPDAPPVGSGVGISVQRVPSVTVQ